MNRRQFLSLTSVGIGTAVAGCTDSLSGGGLSENSLPRYHTWLPAVEPDEGAGFIHLDVARFNRLAEIEDESPTPTPEKEDEDVATPLLAAPIVGSLFAVSLGLGFGLSGFGSVSERIFSQFEGDFRTEETSVETDDELQSITFAGGAVAFEGTFDTEAYVKDLPASFAESESRDGYTIYQDTDEGSSNVIAINNSTIVTSFGDNEGGLTASGSLQRVIDAKTGAGERFVDQYPDADWALRTAGNNGFVLVSAGDTEVEQNEEGDSTYDPLSGTALSQVDASVLVSGASINVDNSSVGSANADTAITHTSDPVEQADIEEIYANSEADVSVSVSEAEEEGAQRVSISANFSTANL